MTEQVHPRERADVWGLLALALAVAATIAVATVPGYTEVSESSDGGSTTRALSLTEVNGFGVLVPPLVLVVAAALPHLLRGGARRVSATLAAVLLTAYVIVGALSIGVWFLPATIAQIVSAVRLPRR